MGVGARPPRTPSVSPRKRKWALAPLEEGEQGEWMENYSSARGRKEVVLEQFKEDAAEGMLIEMSMAQAVHIWGGRLMGAALGGHREAAGLGEVQGHL